MSETGDAYDDEALAAEYVLHLLDADERSAFEKRLRDDRGLQARVLDWEAKLAPLSDEFEPVTPTSALKSRIMHAVAPASKKPFVGRTWSLVFGGAVVVALMAAIVFGTFLRDPNDLSPAFQAELSAEDGSLLIVAGVIPATHEIVLERVAGAPRPGRVHELWLIAEGAPGPVSLGILEDQGTTRIRVPDDIAPGVRTGTLAISDEPPGGSPTGAPTGEVLATATFVDI
jgi:anti-sigma-K factor RskA